MRQFKITFFIVSFTWIFSALTNSEVLCASAAKTFESDVKPLLEKYCLSCHNSERHQSGLVLENLDSLLEGGALHGPSVIGGSSQNSPLIEYLLGEKQPQMPLSGNALSKEEILTIAAWIDQLKVTSQKKKKELKWPWTKLQTPLIPEVNNTNWGKSSIDAFILNKQEKKGLHSAPPASPRALLRRLYFDLIGLPPSPEEMRAFLEDPSENAYKNQIEKLLANPRYGERWGRHWLDLVRYADSFGGGLDYPLPHIWRYRDYVIRAFNQDRPYDRFIKEQLAGDAYRGYGAEGKIALGFMRLGVQIEGSGDSRRDFLNDVVNTTGSVFLGVTLGCARCHDHKYDPISHKDFYRIEAFFAPTHQPTPASNQNSGKLWLTDVPFTPYELPNLNPKIWKRKSQGWDDKLANWKKSGEEFKKKLKERTEGQLNYVLTSPQDLKDWALSGLKHTSISRSSLYTKEEEEQLRIIGKQTTPFINPNHPTRFKPIAYVPKEPMGSTMYAPTTFLLQGGNTKLKEGIVEPGFIRVLHDGPESVNLDVFSGSRRRLMANWIASAENPLTARVMVYRIWQHHFTKGLVPSPSDFGNNGMGTVHPALIDHLATKFIESGWSIKNMHRLILQSSVYRQSVNHPHAQQLEKIDPQNHYLWKMPSIRLESEVIRDSMLAVSGQLNPLMGGPSFFPDFNDEIMRQNSTWWEPDSEEERSRRSIYILQLRSLISPFMTVFDGADTSQSCSVRSVTTVTPQVFALFNGPLAHRQSKLMAQRIKQEVGNVPQDQIQRAFQLALQREPTLAEKQKSLAFLGQEKNQIHEASIKKISANLSVNDSDQKTAVVRDNKKYNGTLSDLCLALFNVNEFIFME